MYRESSLTDQWQYASDKDRIPHHAGHVIRSGKDRPLGASRLNY
jgi:hypothetical protein